MAALKCVFGVYILAVLLAAVSTVELVTGDDTIPIQTLIEDAKILRKAFDDIKKADETFDTWGESRQMEFLNEIEQGGVDRIVSRLRDNSTEGVLTENPVTEENEKGILSASVLELVDPNEERPANQTGALKGQGRDTPTKYQASATYYDGQGAIAGVHLDSEVPEPTGYAQTAAGENAETSESYETTEALGSNYKHAITLGSPDHDADLSELTEDLGTSYRNSGALADAVKNTESSKSAYQVAREPGGGYQDEGILGNADHNTETRAPEYQNTGENEENLAFEYRDTEALGASYQSAGDRFNSIGTLEATQVKGKNPELAQNGAKKHDAGHPKKGEPAAIDQNKLDQASGFQLAEGSVAINDNSEGLISDAEDVHKTQSVAELELCERNALLYCPCGLTTVEVPIAMCRVKGTTTCRPCYSELSISAICSKYKYCLSCYTDDGTCDSCLGLRTGPFCEKKIGFLGVRKVTTVYLIREPIRERVKRMTKCTIPIGLNTADIHCTVAEDSTVCEQKCVWGYRLDSGVMSNFTCDMKNGEWSPSEPTECKPYINCDIKFKGSFEAARKCTFNLSDCAPVCQVDCGGNNSNHTCTLDGNWFPELPECVEKDSELVTVKYFAPGE